MKISNVSDVSESQFRSTKKKLYSMLLLGHSHIYSMLSTMLIATNITTQTIEKIAILARNFKSLLKMKRK